jgi:hypothetical protein
VLSPVSPVSERSDVLGGAAELQSPWAQRPHEVSGDRNVHEVYGMREAAELHGPWAQHPHEVSGDPNVHEVYGTREAAELHSQHPHSELQGSQHYIAGSGGPISELPGHKWGH